MTQHSTSQPAMAYPTPAQYARWKARAGELDMSVSEFMQAMIEAGIKADQGFEIDTTEPTASALREQRNELKAELDRARARITRLEDQLYHGERRTVERYVTDHPGATFEEIVQHLIETVPQRVAEHLDELDGDQLTHDGDAYYPTDDT